MKTRLIGKYRGREKRAISAVIGGVILFSIIITVGFGYFYTTTQDQQVLAVAQKQSSNFLAQKIQENLYITGSLVGGNLTFAVNNTGITTILVAYFLINQAGNLVQYSSAIPTNPLACSSASATIPCTLNTGTSAVFNTKIGYATGSFYTIKVLTNRGTTIVGTYPTQVLTSISINSQIASGLGSLEMIFSSFTFYGYTTSYKLCVSGYSCAVNLSSALPAAITPFESTSVPIVFSAVLTNNDPTQGTIVVDAHTDLWTFLSCGSGCGTQSLLGFYVMNVAPNGTITSRTPGSFAPIMVPYGTTKTIYFGSSCDLSLSSCSSYTPQSISDNFGEHDVFMIFSGTLVTATNSTLYSQNLPYSATFAADNIAGLSQTPTTCANGSSSTFTLTVTNSKWSPYTITSVTIQASSFSNLAYVAQPLGWTAKLPISGVTLQWTTLAGIAPGQSATFQWSGTAPVVAVGTQSVFPTTVTWNGGTIQSQELDTGCYVG